MIMPQDHSSQLHLFYEGAQHQHLLALSVLCDKVRNGTQLGGHEGPGFWQLLCQLVGELLPCNALDHQLWMDHHLPAASECLHHNDLIAAAHPHPRLVLAVCLYSCIHFCLLSAVESDTL